MTDAVPFVLAWEKSGSAEVVAAKLRSPLETVLRFAWHYRDAGVPLKHLRGLPRPRNRRERLKEERAVERIAAGSRGKVKKGNGTS